MVNKLVVIPDMCQPFCALLPGYLDGQKQTQSIFGVILPQLGVSVTGHTYKTFEEANTDETDSSRDKAA